LQGAGPVRQAGAMKERIYGLMPVLAVNEGPDYENKNYEEKIPVLLKTVSLTIAGERVAFPACFPARPMPE
jgi:hypothetical protein